MTTGCKKFSKIIHELNDMERLKNIHTVRLDFSKCFISLKDITFVLTTTIMIIIITIEGMR